MRTTPGPRTTQLKSVASRKLSLGMLLLPAALLLAGCQTAFVGNPFPWTVPLTVSGTLRGAQQPIASSQIQLFEVDISQTGYLSNQPLLAKSVVSDANGAFSINQSVTCTSPEAMTYLLATGGSPKITRRPNNPNISLVAMLGPCSGLSSVGPVTVNEVTTIGSLFPFATWLGSPAAQTALNAMPQSTVATLGLNAISSVTAMINVSTGTAPGVAGAAIPLTQTQKLNTLANIVAACVNSPGGTAGDNTPCGKLFQLATPAGGTAPKDTEKAIVNIAMNPTVNVGSLYQLALATTPYQPNLAGAPTDWSLTPSATGSVAGGSGTNPPAGGTSGAPAGGVTATGNRTLDPGYSGPIVITSGGTYTGKWESLDPSQPAVIVVTDQPVIIQNSVVRSRSQLIVAHGGSAGLHLQILNTVGQALNPNVPGQAAGPFLYADGITSLDVAHTSMTGVSSGIYLSNCSPTHLSLLDNQASNMDDRASDGNNGHTTVRPGLGHFIIFDTVKALNGAEIAWNQVINVIGQASTEDIINMDSSRGGSPSLLINIHDNYLQGAVSAVGMPYTGSGITTDGDASSANTESAYILINKNQVVLTQNHGINVPTGHDVTVSNNRVVSTGMDSFGTWLAPIDNTGCGYCLMSTTPTWYYNILFTDNYGGLARLSPAAKPARYDVVQTAASTQMNNVAQNFTLIAPPTSAAAITSAMQTNEFTLWTSKLTTAGQVVGASPAITP